MFIVRSFVVVLLVYSSIAMGALDHNLSLSEKGKDGFSGESFGAELDQTRAIMSEISSEREGVKFLIYGTEKFKDFIFATPVMSEASGWVKEGFNIAFDGANWLADTLYDGKIETAAKGAIYKAWVNDKAEIEKAFAIKNHSDKTRAVLSVVESLDDFGEYLGRTNMSTDQRAVLNSRMILKLADITQKVTVNSLQNSAEIKKLKAAHKEYKKFRESNLDELKQYLDLRKQYNAMSQEVHRKGGEAANKIASVLENPDYTPEDVRAGRFSDKDRQAINKSMADISDAMAKAEVYLGKASQIANNLLKGKDAERVNKALFYAGNGVKVVGGIARAYNGDAMGAMDAMVGVSNLLGKDKTSPEQQRHQQIMQAFGEVFKNQKLIIENQKRMYELQVKTYELVANLYNLSRQNFKYVNERIDVILGNQAALLGNVVEFSDVKENLNYCKVFLNSRFKCRSEFLESNGDILRCVSQIMNQKDVGDYRDDFVPYEQPASTVLVRGYLSSYKDLLSHFESGQNKSNFRRCHKGLTTILQHDLHPLFVSKTYPISGAFTTYNDRFLIPVYKPLMELSDKYYMTSDRGANALYRALLIPHKSASSLSLKSQNIRKLLMDTQDHELLTLDQVQDGLYSHIYMPALDHFMSSFTEMSSYWDLVEGDLDGEFELAPESRIKDHVDTIGSRELVSHYRKLVKVVELAIAQQNLISGDILLPLLRRIAKSGGSHPDYGLVAQAVKNNYYLGKNLFVYSLTSEFDSKHNPQDYYQSYSEYEKNGLGDCLWNGAEKNYGDNCKIRFLTETNLPFIFRPGGVYLNDSKEVTVAKADSVSLKEKKLEYSPHYYRTLRLKQQLYSRMSNYKGVAKEVLEENLYVFP